MDILKKFGCYLINKWEIAVQSLDRGKTKMEYISMQTYVSHNKIRLVG